MKTISLISFVAAAVTALVTFTFGVASLYAIAPCIFLMLIAAGDYGPKSQSRFRSIASNQDWNTRPASTHSYRLAA